jgi:hypothetical protein
VRCFTSMTRRTLSSILRCRRASFTRVTSLR